MPRPARWAPFFRQWQPAMAYALGFWWADGCMRIKRPTTAHEIQFASNDRDHLLLLMTVIGERFYLGRVAPESDTWTVSLCSRQMYEDLLALGGMPAKSRTIQLPAVPASCLPHFVRGFVDGDGSLLWNGDRPVLQIYSASPHFLQQLGAALEQATGIPAPNLIANRDLWTIKWSTTRAKCLAAWLYVDNPGVALERKAVIAEQFLSWLPKKKPNQGTITDAMRVQFAAYLTE